MTSPHMAWWRGYVNMVIYDPYPTRRVEDEVVIHCAKDMIQQRAFTHPVEDYYQAVAAGLASGVAGVIAWCE